MKTISDLIWDMENDEKKIENTGRINTCSVHGVEQEISMYACCGLGGGWGWSVSCGKHNY